MENNHSKLRWVEVFIVAQMQFRSNDIFPRENSVASHFGPHKETGGALARKLNPEDNLAL